MKWATARFVKFDHDFIGREALEKKKDKPHRHKVTFEWNTDDVAKIFRSFFDPEVENYKYIDLPLSNYGSASFDTIKKGNKTVGLSMFSGTTWNDAPHAIAWHGRSRHQAAATY